MIAIGEDNAPELRDLEQLIATPPTRQFAVEAAPGRFYFVNFATYRTGLFAELHHPDDAQVNLAVIRLATVINAGGIDRLEPCASGNPMRNLEFALDGKHHLLASVGVLTAEPVGIHPPTDPELHQLFSFLSRCHPLA